jgi:hypothetical protein
MVKSSGGRDGISASERRHVMTKTYDQKCYQLAADFLEDEPCRDDQKLFERHCHTLALAIQQAIEDWFDTPDDDQPVPSAQGKTP